MSLDAVSWAMGQTVGRSAAKLLLVTLAHCVNGKGTDNMICFPSNAFLAEQSELDKKSVQANLKWLIEKGFLEKTGGTHGRTKQVTEYRLKEPNIGHLESAPEGSKGTQISPETAPILGTFTEEERYPDFPAKVPRFPPKGTQISLERYPNLGNGTSKEQVKEQVTEQVKAKKRGRGNSSDLPDGFAEFWQQYPNKSAKIKAAGLWVSKRLDRDLALRDKVMAALAAHRKLSQWTKDGGRFIPLPSTWLGNERWTDEVGTSACGGTGNGTWWRAAGFANVYEAENEGCYEHNAQEFRGGKRSPATEVA